MKEVCGLFLIFVLNSQLLVAQESNLTQCIIRYMGIAPTGGFPELCRPTIEQNLDTFVPVCKEENFDACLDAIAEAASFIAPVCNKPLSNVKRSLLFCELQLQPS